MTQEPISPLILSRIVLADDFEHLSLNLAFIGNGVCLLVQQASSHPILSLCESVCVCVSVCLSVAIMCLEIPF